VRTADAQRVFEDRLTAGGLRVRDWGDGPSFEYDVTRQFIINRDVDHDDDAVWQLSADAHRCPKRCDHVRQRRWQSASATRGRDLMRQEIVRAVGAAFTFSGA
jgi:hypothetical protein